MSMQHANTFRILTLDGGGARGYLSAAILCNIEKSLGGLPLGQQFDLIAGTSTGSILAAGLAAGMKAETLFHVYEDNLDEIFSPARWRFGGLRRSRYEPTALRKVLQSELKGLTLADVSTDLCVVTVALQNGQPRLYKSDYLRRNTPRERESLVDVVMASCAAPSFFPPASSLKTAGLLVDGGVCANNPALVALIDALQFERASRSRGTPSPDGDKNKVVLLSVGTGQRPGLPYNAPDLARGGLVDWLKPRFLRSWLNRQSLSVPLIELLLESQTSLVEAQAQYLLGDGHYLRINPKLGRSTALDDTRHLKELLNYADLDKTTDAWLRDHFGGGAVSAG